ncbi:CC-NBS-LRR resistance protein, partial [Trifolium medium]|nr:CC-NBS-LRR resistance protein [Trifolium medium]
KPSPRPSSLQSLNIESSFPIELFKVKLKMDTLTALERLSLRCEEVSFCEGVCLPPKLQSIMTVCRRATPPVKEWGLRGLTSLSGLSIGKSDDLVNPLMMESLLPISLKNLDFDYCEFESLPENCFPSSLKKLGLYFCEKLESLPEDSLPDSLEMLEIWECPLLEERYKMKEHWSKIAHIPIIEINGQVTVW